MLSRFLHRIGPKLRLFFLKKEYVSAPHQLVSETCSQQTCRLVSRKCPAPGYRLLDGGVFVCVRVHHLYTDNVTKVFCLPFPPTGHGRPCNRGFDREGVRRPGEEVARVSRCPDTPAGPQASRHAGHPRAKAPRRRHQFRGKPVLPGQLHVLSSARPPALLFQPPLSSRFPEIQKSVLLR